MNDKQEVFVREYMLDCNATAAAIRAGYSRKGAAQTGAKLLRNTKVKKAVDAAKQAGAKRTQIDRDWVVDRLVELHDASLLKGDLKNARGCLELLGKTNSSYVDRIQTDQTVTVNIIRPDRAKVNPARP